MPSFDDLKKAAQAELIKDEARAKSWFAAHRATLIACAVCLLAGFILAKAFG